MRTIERLAAARPETDDPMDVAGADHRDRLLLSILADPAAAPSRHLPIARIAGAAAAAAVAIALITGLPSNQGAPKPDTAGSAQTAPLLLDRVKLAVAEGANGILRIESDYGNGVRWETWLDEPGQQWRSTSRTPDGHALYEHQVNEGTEGTSVVVVSHQDRAWWTYTAPEWRDSAKLYLTPEEIRTQLENGELREIARRSEADREEVLLRGDASQKAPGVYTAAIDLWIDADTYLPTRLSATLAHGRAATVTYTWLPRTEKYLRNTRVDITGGYRHLPNAPAQPGSEERG